MLADKREDYLSILRLCLRSQIASLKRGQHLKYSPFAFTEQGVAMLSSIFNREKAVQVNIEIMRAFAKYRALLVESKNFRLELKTSEHIGEPPLRHPQSII